MVESADKREFSRAPARVEVRLTNSMGQTLEGRCVNVSMNGVLVDAPKTLPVGNACGVELVLDGGDTQVRVNAHGEVARVDENGLAVVFTEVDADSLPHLQRLVLYNADDTDRAENEMEDHLGIKRKPRP